MDLLEDVILAEGQGQEIEGTITKNIKENDITTLGVRYELLKLCGALHRLFIDFQDDIPLLNSGFISCIPRFHT